MKRKISFQPVVNHENKCRARCCAEACNPTAPVQASKAMLLPEGDALIPKCTSPFSITDGHSLHTRLDRVGGEEKKVVRHTC